MLLSLTKKLCPLFSLALATVGCGKKVTNTASSAIRSIEADPPANLVLSYSSLEGRTKNYLIPKNGRFYIPTSVNIQAGDGRGQKISVIYNYDINLLDFEYRCDYSSTTNPEKLTLVGCYDYSGTNLGEVRPNPFMIDKGYYIRIELKSSPEQDLKIEIVHKNVSWT